jgi:hypothetical protein
VGRWEGSTTVESITGEIPSCIAPFWRPMTTDAVSADIYPLQDGALNMVLHQQASEECHLQLTLFQDLVSGGLWDSDENHCFLVPALCRPGCYGRLRSSEWNCEGAPPEVWISGVALNGTVSGESIDRMLGTMEITYDQRPANSAPAVGYRRLTVVTRFDISKTSRP